MELPNQRLKLCKLCKKHKFSFLFLDFHFLINDATVLIIHVDNVVEHCASKPHVVAIINMPLRSPVTDFVGVIISKPSAPV